MATAKRLKPEKKTEHRRRFVFKTFSQRIEAININVYQSLDPLKSEPTTGSSFFRDSIVQWRELNTAADFISFYDEMMPVVQTLPQIILHKEKIVSQLLCRLHMKGILSLEPLLRLISVLSRDLLEDFIPFLPKIVDSVVLLLNSGADREPEVIEQIFTSWSEIMMYLQKYLVRDVVYILKVTVGLRYYPKEYIQEFMAESISFLMRNAPWEQFVKGIRKIMNEVVMKPSATKNSSVSALLSYVMRATSSRLHSRAEKVLRLLVNKSILDSSGKSMTEGSETVHVLIATFQRLFHGLEAKDLDLIQDCLSEKIMDPRTSGQYLSRLLSLLISTIQIDNAQKVSDFKPLLQLVEYLMKNFVIPHSMINSEDHSSGVIDKVLQLMLCILDGLSSPKHMTALSELSLQWTSIFKLRNLSLLTFLRELLLKDPCVLQTFRHNIISALADLVEKPEGEVVYLLLIFCEKQVHSSSLFEETSKKELSRICHFLEKTIRDQFQEINLGQFQEINLTQLWGIITCYSYMVDVQANPSLLMDLVDAIDRLLTNPETIAGFPKHAWENLIGAGLNSFHKLQFGHKAGMNGSAVCKFLYFAKKYKSCAHILFSVAEYLDSVDGSSVKVDGSDKVYHPELEARNALEALDIFSENLCDPDKQIRLSTLRILCHYQYLDGECCTSIQLSEKKMITEESQTSHVDEQSSNVLQLLLSIEEISLSIDTSRRVILLITRIQMELSAGRVSETLLPAVLNGVIGLFYNRFNHLWNPAMECLAVLVGHYFGTVWERWIEHLDHCESYLLTDQKQSEGTNMHTSSDSGDLVRRFSVFNARSYDSTPQTTVLSLLIQSLQKMRTVVESRSRQIVPLFLKFLGYKVEDLSSVRSYNALACKGKEWKSVLKDWLNLLSSLRKPKSFYRSQFLKEVLEYRLLDENDAEVQLKVLESLLNWKDDFIIPYEQHLKNLISTKNLREELTTWSLSRESNLIDEQHRACLVPIVIRILVPKVRKLKTLASRKHASLQNRKAVIGFLAGLDVDELPLFITLLIKPLQNMVDSGGWCSSNSLKGLNSCSALSRFSLDNIKELSLKKIFGFLHVIEEIFLVFDESRVSPFLNLLMACVTRILASCTSGLEDAKSSCSTLSDSEADSRITASISVNQFKDLRSLCLKIISLVLKKYEDHDYGCEFWDLFLISVKPLTDNFKQEAASSEKPSSLFLCFVGMSRSYKLASFLFRVENLVHDVFSILEVMTASDAVVSCALEFIENLLNLGSELNSGDTDINRLLQLNIGTLVCSLHSLFARKNVSNRKFDSYEERDLTILKLLSKYIKDPSLGRKFVDILLPLLNKRQHTSDACLESLQVIRHIIPILDVGSTSKIVNSVSPLLISATMDIRSSICDLLDALAGNDSSLRCVAKLLCDLNATSPLEMGGLDYEIIIGAYERINIDFFNCVRPEHVLVLFSHCIFDMSSQELILRSSAQRLLLLFIDFSKKALDQKVESSKGFWSRASIQDILTNFLIKHMGIAMNKEASVQKVWIDLLREMVLKLSEVLDLETYQSLCSEDPEQDFFKNIIHMQKHRRARALSRFSGVVRSGKLSLVITNTVFMPLFFNMLLDVQDGKGENLRNASVEALASISGSMKWKQYYGLLIKCFRETSRKPDKQKLFLRLICSILDHFPFFPATQSRDETKYFVEDVSTQGTSETTSLMVVDEYPSAAKRMKIQTCLRSEILPKIQNLLTSDTDNVSANVSLVALKLLKLLPGDIMQHLPSIIHRISNFLKHRLESVRDEARSALVSCLKELGLEYLQFIVKVLRATLKRGYELHVLGYTVNFLLSKCLLYPMHGGLDYCLEELLSVAENDILGDVSEEKEVEKIASKMKETRKQKSFETLKLIAQNISFDTYALKLLSPVTGHLPKQLTPKLKTKLETMLSHLASGIECNPTAAHTDLFIFIYGLLEDPQCSPLIKVFALNILCSRMKSMKVHKKEAQLLSLLDPLVKLLCSCLSSKYEDILSASLSCLFSLVKLPLPSLASEANNIKTSLLVIAQGSMNASSPLMQSCLRLLTVLLQSTEITLSSDQLHMLVQFPLFVDLERNPSFIALSLLKAIVNRKLVVHEIFDIVKRVGELMVTSQVEAVRKKCSQILLQFLRNYQLSKDRRQEHFDFLLGNLRYEHSTGREAVLEMLHAIIIKFDISVVDYHCETFFVHLMICLANDNDNKVRAMTGASLKLLFGRVKPHSLNSIVETARSWYFSEKQNLWSAAAQVLGLLVGVMKKGFQPHIDSVLSVVRRILLSAINIIKHPEVEHSDEATIPLWKEAYYSIVLLEKVLREFPELCLTVGLEDIWETICEYLLHPHMWLRHISNRLVEFYFENVTKACTDDRNKSVGEFHLMRLSRLFLIAASLCDQLNAPLGDDAFSSCLRKNIVMATCRLHSALGQESTNTHLYWSAVHCDEKICFLKAFQVLNPNKGRGMFEYLLSGLNGQNDHENMEPHRYILVSYLLKRLGKMALQKGATQMKIVFDSFKSISRDVLEQHKVLDEVDENEDHDYVYLMLFPLYKVCEGFAGKVIPDDLKQLAEEVRDSIRDSIGLQKFVQVYSQIRTKLKAKREKRRHTIKVMAVTNPERNAKRKLKNAKKHQANKRRKIMTMKLGRCW